MPVEINRHDGVAVLTISNGPLNVFTPSLHKELYDRLREVESDEAIRVSVLTGAGNRAFSAGDDIKTPQPIVEPHEFILRNLRPSVESADRYPGWEREVLSMSRHKPIIGAVRGWCLGQGLIYLASLTDLRVAGQSSQFGLPEIAYGMPGGAAHAGLFDQVPRGIAVRMALTGEPISAADALRAFLVDEVVPDEVVVDRAIAIAASIARHSPLGIALEMEAIRRASSSPSNVGREFADVLYCLERVANMGTDLQNPTKFFLKDRGK